MLLKFSFPKGMNYVIIIKKYFWSHVNCLQIFVAKFGSWEHYKRSHIFHAKKVCKNKVQK